ncbi:hypothetical protein ACHWQZ_G006022 [Mnemiopsis leidyi]
MTGRAGHNPDKRFLSKGILQMKFMSRSSHAPEEVSTASGNRDTQWIVDSGAVSQRNIIIDESYMKLEDLCEIGRITSKQFNPYIEKILAEKNRLRDSDEPSDDQEDVQEMDGVSASEMSSRYNSLVSNKKRAPGLGDDSSDEEETNQDATERRKFLKPS